MRRLQDKHLDPVLLPKTSFGERLARLNGLAEAGFAGWDFLPGMRFGERAAWWRGGADRGSPHEGLDLCWYRTREGRRLPLAPGARVPAIYPGEVVSVVRDFLGSTVFVAHDRFDDRGRRLHTICGHIDPRPGLLAGSLLPDGGEVGTVSGPCVEKSGAPPHLHVTIALIAPACGPGRLDWGTLQDRRRVLLLDPLPVVCGLPEPD